MADHLIRVVSADGMFRGVAAVTTDLVRTVCETQQTDLTATIALGRLLTGGALLSSLLKGEQRLALAVEGNGPVGKISVEADANGKIRGNIRNPITNLPPAGDHFDVAGAVGRAGFLHVWKDLGLKKPYQSMVQLQSSEIAEDIAYYLAESEQTPSAIGVGVQVNSSGTIVCAAGFLVQSLPPADEDLINSLESNVKKLGSVTDFIHQGKTPQDVLDILFGSIPHRTLFKQALRYQCSCSQNKMQKALLTLTKEDLIKLKEEKTNGVEVRCEFCANVYVFNQSALQKIIEKL